MGDNQYTVSKYYLSIIIDDKSLEKLQALENILKQSGDVRDIIIQDDNDIDNHLTDASQEVQALIIERQGYYKQNLSFNWGEIKTKAKGILQTIEAINKVVSSKSHENKAHIPVIAETIEARQILIVVRCKSEAIYQSFKNGLDDLAFEFIKKHLAGREITRSNPKKYMYDDRLLVDDEYGLWTFYKFFDVVSMTLYRIENVDLLAILYTQLFQNHNVGSYLENIWSSYLIDFPLKWKLNQPELMDQKKQFIFILTKDSTKKADTHESHTSLQSFLIAVAESNKKSAANAENWLKVLRSEDIENMDDISSLDEKGWSKLSSKLTAKGAQLIRKEVDSRKISWKLQETFESRAYQLSLGHRLRRFFHYELNKESRDFKCLPDLDVYAVQEAFKEISQNFKGEKLLKALREDFFLPFCVEKSKNMDTQRGLLLYGPPGTGKTMLMDELPQKLGLTPVSFPISAPEVNRSLVGQTEKVINALFDRARQMPHLLCCIAIDEIDRLAPKRDQKSGEHKSDVLCMLLSLIGGAKDVPNLIIISSTNLLNKIDEAFRRRMSGQFFVGRPDGETRLELFKRIDEDAPNFLSKKEYDLLQEITVNFTGAAIKSVITALITEYKLQWKKNQILSKAAINELIFEKCIRKSRQFNIFVGKEILADVLRKIENFKIGSNMPFMKVPDRFTGKILIDCSTFEMQFELKNKVSIDELTLYSRPKITEMAKLNRDFGCIKMETVTVNPNGASVLNVNHILPLFAKLVKENNIEYVQLIDQNLLRANAAFDESAVAEVWQEKMQEFEEYSRVLFIFDLDSLATMNLSTSTSESGMGPSTSLSIGNTRLFNYVIDAMKSANIVDRSRQKWVATMICNDKLKELFIKTIFWPLTIEGIEEEIDKIKMKEEKQCVRCGDLYLEKDSNYTSCTYHETTIMIEKTEHGLYNRGKMKKSHLEQDIFKRGIKNENLVYVCCMQPFGSAGCKKNKHSDNKEEWDAYCDLKDSNIFVKKAQKYQ